MTTERIRPKLNTGVGLTKQSFKDECDINFILSKWKRTGQIPPSQVGTLPPHYGDFSNPTDYMDALNAVLEAKEAFAALPAFLRDRFANEPANLLRFLSIPENQEEAIRLGLAQPPPSGSPDPKAEGETSTPEGETSTPSGETSTPEGETGGAQ